MRCWWRRWWWRGDMMNFKVYLFLLFVHVSCIISLRCAHSSSHHRDIFTILSCLFNSKFLDDYRLFIYLRSCHFHTIIHIHALQNYRVCVLLSNPFLHWSYNINFHWHTVARHFSGKKINTSKDEIRAKLKPTRMTITKNVMTAALANEPVVGWPRKAKKSRRRKKTSKKKN